MSDIRFTVLGEPVSKGSTVSSVVRNGRGGIVYANGHPKVRTHDQSGARGKASERNLGLAALAARQEAGWKLLRNESVEVKIRFYRARNKGHFGSGKNAGLLKDSAPARPAVKPDLDKLIRHVLDALTGVIYTDDGQVVTILATKAFAEGDDPPRTEVSVRICKQQTVGDTMADAQMALAAA